MDWEAWACKAESALAFDRPGSFRELFAEDAVFADPHTPSTRDLKGISRQTRKIFPDWSQEITCIRGGPDWAFFEWIGRGTFYPETARSEAAGDAAPDPATGIAVTMEGATVIEVDATGRVTQWRDYLDRKQPENQIRAALKARARRED